MGEKHILRFRRIEFEIVRRKPERDLVKVRLENMHVKRRVNWFENENVIGIENDLREERERKVGILVSCT